MNECKKKLTLEIFLVEQCMYVEACGQRIMSRTVFRLLDLMIRRIIQQSTWVTIKRDFVSLVVVVKSRLNFLNEDLA